MWGNRWVGQSVLRSDALFEPWIQEGGAHLPIRYVWPIGSTRANTECANRYGDIGIFFLLMAHKTSQSPVVGNQSRLLSHNGQTPATLAWHSRGLWTYDSIIITPLPNTMVHV